MRIAIYARVSTDDKGQDTANQLIPLREFASKMGWTVVKEYLEESSASQGKYREMFQGMFRDARQRNQFDLVLFWSLDRFSREGAVATIDHLRKLTSYKVGWKSYTEQYLDSMGMFKEAVIAILATIAQQERNRMSDRTKAGMAKAAATGGKGPKPVVVDVAVLEKLREGGKSIRQIAGETGVSRASVARMLSQAAVSRGYSLSL